MPFIRSWCRYQSVQSESHLVLFDPDDIKNFDKWLRSMAKSLDSDNDWQHQKQQRYKMLLLDANNNHNDDDGMSLEDVKGLRNGARLLLVPLPLLSNTTDENQQAPPAAAAAAAAATATTTTTTTQKKIPVKVKTESKANKINNDADADDDEVEDTTKQVLEQRKKDIEFIELSSDSEDVDNDDEDGSVQEGSDAWDSSSSEEEEDNSDEDDGDLKPKAVTTKKTAKQNSTQKVKAESKPKIARRQRKVKAPKESPLQVEMDAKDIPAAPGLRMDNIDEEMKQSDGAYEEVSTLVDGSTNNSKSSAEKLVKDRIIKLLNTGFHSESNENEAKNAMKLAQRLMQKHNLSQALLLKEREDKNKNSTQPDGEILKGGSVTVRIYNRKMGKPALFARWLCDLADPIADNFKVRSYHTARRGLECSVTFYGIYTNAQLAGYAYKVATERIAQMMAEHQPAPTICWWKNISTKSSRLSYAIGMVDGIDKEVQRTIKLEQERRDRKLQQARLAVATGEAYEESDDDDNDDGPGYSITRPFGDDDARNKIPETAASMPKPYAAKSTPGDESESNEKVKPLSGRDLDRRVQELEREQEAALVLVNHEEKVADKVLEDEGIKLYAGVKRKAIDMDRRSYKQGVEDSKEIDINQRAIRDETKVKREKP